MKFHKPSLNFKLSRGRKAYESEDSVPTNSMQGNNTGSGYPMPDNGGNGERSGHGCHGGNGRNGESSGHGCRGGNGGNGESSGHGCDGGNGGNGGSSGIRQRDTDTGGRLNCRGEDTNRDLGNAPYAFNISKATGENTNYRTALWTGKHLQLTVMSIPVGEETGVEMHPDLDQFIRIESGMGEVSMGRLRSNMNYKVALDRDFAILIPAGTYHNVVNTGKAPLKLYSIYTPKAHPFGTVDITKADSERREMEEK